MGGLDEEAKAFDSQIIERVKNGHIPDIRMVKPCDYFYNNSWRHPDYVKLDMGEQAELIHKALQEHGIKTKSILRVLEVGCGPGWLSLELARLGNDVTGLDLSPDSIAIAREFADNDPWRETRGKLEYMAGDFFASGLPEAFFDAVVFQGALHHFAEQQRVMDEVKRLLREGGLIIAHEPTRDRMTEGNAALIHLVRVLLTVQNGFFKDVPIPDSTGEYDEAVNTIYKEMKYEDEAGEKVQSAHDNDAGHNDMYSALRNNFREVVYQERYAFFHEIIGGLRFDQQTNARLARYLRDADAKLCRTGALQSMEFFFVGRKES